MLMEYPTQLNLDLGFSLVSGRQLAGWAWNNGHAVLLVVSFEIV